MEFVFISPPSVVSQTIIRLSFCCSRAGYLEHSKRPGERVERFKLSELENNNMAYVHQSSALTTLGFQAWDGEDYSNVYDLNIQVKNKTKTEMF